MDTLRRSYADFARHWRAARPGQRRAWLAATSAALCVFALTGTLVAFGGRFTPAADPAALTSPIDTAAATDTSASTATKKPSPTAHRRTPTPTYKPPHAPPPPPGPPKPHATPTATFCPTPTPQPTPT